MAMVSDVRKPNWDVWQLVPEARVWEAVALSLDREPRTVRVTCDGPLVVSFFEEGQVFEDRLLVAEANFGTNNPLTPLRFSMGQRRTSYVSLPQFAAWVSKIRWDAPAELLAMADQEAAEAGSVKRRKHNKRDSEARYREWQERINKLAQDSPGKSHLGYCRTLGKEVGVPFKTIQRRTKLGHS